MIHADSRGNLQQVIVIKEGHICSHMEMKGVIQEMGGGVSCMKDGEIASIC